MSREAAYLANGGADGVVGGNRGVDVVIDGLPG